MVIHGSGRRHLLIVFVGAILLSLVLGEALAQEEEVVAAGKPIYKQHCAACHGSEGKGDGSLAELLTLRSVDLRQLSKRHEGQFPFWYVYRVIDGRAEVKGHGTTEMPIWGSAFRLEAGSHTLAEAQVRGQILALVYYLQSIQEE